MTPSTCSAQKKTGGQQEGEHGWVQHVQGEYYQRNVLKVFVILSGLVRNPESSSVHRRSLKSINKSPSPKFLESGYSIYLLNIHIIGIIFYLIFFHLLQISFLYHIMIIEHVKGTEGAQSSPATVIESIYPIIILIKVLWWIMELFCQALALVNIKILFLYKIFFHPTKSYCRLTNFYSWFKPDLHRCSLRTWHTHVLGCFVPVTQIRHWTWVYHWLTEPSVDPAPAFSMSWLVMTGRVMCDAAWHTAWQITPTSDGRMKGLWQCSDGIGS